jgi:glycosyltransferase involved in cell wall biosynthesis
MKRVLFLDHSAQLGGAELSLLDLARNLPACRVLLFADGPFRQRLAEAGVAVDLIRAPDRVMGVRRESRLHALTALPGILRLAARVAAIARGFDVIHCNSQKAFIVGSLAGVIARRPVIWHLRDMLTHSSFSGFNRKVTVALANRVAALVLTNSRATAEAFAAVGGDQQKAAVLYNGIDFPVPAGVPGLRGQLGLAEGAPVLGCFSRLSPWKGQHVLIAAAAALRRRHPQLAVLLVGSPLFDEDAYAAELHRLVAQLGLQEQVRFLGFRADVAELMALCDVVVHTSVEPEPFGRVIIEGQQAGKPVIATQGGGADELVAHGETGLLVPPGDAEVLAAAVEQLLADPSLAGRLAEQGRRSATEGFTVQRMVARFKRFLGEEGACGAESRHRS